MVAPVAPATAVRHRRAVPTLRSLTRSPRPEAPARAHGAFNVVGGVWPLLHLSSFEAVLGPKADRWLVKTVAGLMVANGVVQLRSATPGELRQAARIGIGTAGVLLLIDLRFAIPGRISRVYLLDAVAEAGWVTAWAVTCRRRRLLVTSATSVDLGRGVEASR
jgi:hypothetical protein